MKTWEIFENKMHNDFTRDEETACKTQRNTDKDIVKG